MTARLATLWTVFVVAAVLFLAAGSSWYGRMSARTIAARGVQGPISRACADRFARHQ